MLRKISRIPPSYYLYTYREDTAAQISAWRRNHFSIGFLSVPSLPFSVEAIVTVPSLRTEKSLVPAGIEIWAWQISRALRVPFWYRAIGKNSISQHELSAWQREHSDLQLHWRKRSRPQTGLRWLIIDDVRTTGSSLRQCSEFICKELRGSANCLTYYYQPKW